MFMGAEKFQKGISSYIKKFAFSNAEQSDLYATLNEVWGQYECRSFNFFDTIVYANNSRAILVLLKYAWRCWTPLPQANNDKDIDVVEVMNTWTLQMNFPVVSVKKYSDSQYVLSQQRFLIADSSLEAEKYASPYGYVK